MSSGSSRSAAKRLTRELAVWAKEAPTETGIERLGPVNGEELLRWEAVINGHGVGSGYDGSSFPSPSSPFYTIPSLFLLDLKPKDLILKERKEKKNPPKKTNDN